MNTDVSYLMSMSCVLPAMVGLYKYKRMEKKIHPFIFMMVSAIVVETIYYLAGKYGDLENASRIVVNIYMLLNFGLFLYLVYSNNYLSKKIMQLFFMLALLVALGNLVYNKTINTAFFYLLCFVSAAMLFISIEILSRQVFETKTSLINNFWFWFSSISILYNAFNLLVFGSYIFVMFGTAAGKAIGTIQHFGNTTCYLLFTVAMIKIPRKN